MNEYPIFFNILLDNTNNSFVLRYFKSWMGTQLYCPLNNTIVFDLALTPKRFIKPHDPQQITNRITYTEFKNLLILVSHWYYIGIYKYTNGNKQQVKYTCDLIIQESKL
jgi:hypothetical protein